MHDVIIALPLVSYLDPLPEHKVSVSPNFVLYTLVLKVPDVGLNSNELSF